MKYVATILILLSLALSIPQASAQPFPRRDGGPQAQQMLPLNMILANIRRQFPGQLSDVQGPRNGILVIKWLTPDGQILFIEADARTGQILGVSGGGNFRRQNFAPTPAFQPDRDRFGRPQNDPGSTASRPAPRDRRGWRDR
jgi:hypothetical protein